ncbi:MAG: hypothetical protein ACYC25_08075, partial [Paludibacter sp.]
GVRLINLEKRNDEIASVCKVLSEAAEEAANLIVEEIEETQIENDEVKGLENTGNSDSIEYSESEDDSESVEDSEE